MKKTPRAVFLKDWIKFHPYPDADECDLYYFRICERVNKLLIREDSLIHSLLDREETARLVFMLTGYFEDVISQTRIWQTFTEKHFGMYGTHLPFYKPEEYFPDEINPEDIYFLLWYFVSLTFKGRKIFNPNNNQLFLLGQDIFEIFSEEFEYAPENRRLLDFLTVPGDESNYYLIRWRIEWISLDSYLFHFNRRTCNNEVEEGLRKIRGTDLEHFSEGFAYDLNDQFVLNRCLPPLALKGKEWLAAMAGKNHPLYQDILNIHPKKTGQFLFRNYDEEYVYLQHLATGKVIGVTRISLDIDPKLQEGKSVLLIGLSNWRDKWWFSGVYSSFPYSKKAEEQEKENPASREFFDEKTDQKLDILYGHYQQFIRFNHGNPMAFFNGKKSAELFINEWQNHLTESLDWTDEELKSSEERMKKAGIHGTRGPLKLDIPDVPLLVWFNPHAGLEFLFGYNHLIPGPGNPFYKKQLHTAETFSLLSSSGISADLVKYLVDQRNLQGLRFPGDQESKTLRENLDFLLRMYKQDEYLPKPQITLF